MSQSEFINELNRLLRSIPEKERLDILADYNEHFLSAFEAGKQESEIIKALGNPKIIAKEIVADFSMQRVNGSFSITNMANATFSVISLGFLNLIFVLGPLIACIAVIFSLIIVALILTIAVPLGLIYSLGFTKDLLYNGFLILMSISIGILLGIALLYATKWFYKLFLRYLQFNLKVVRRNNR